MSQQPHIIRTPRDAEKAAHDWMRRHGFDDAELTQEGADGGVDVISARAVAQVKAEVRMTGRPQIQQLAGIARVTGKQGLFFSLGGYTREAQGWAQEAGVALFEFNLIGEIEPLGHHADWLVSEVTGQESMAEALGYMETASMSRAAGAAFSGTLPLSGEWREVSDTLAHLVVAGDHMLCGNPVGEEEGAPDGDRTSWSIGVVYPEQSVALRQYLLVGVSPSAKLKQAADSLSILETLGESSEWRDHDGKTQWTIKVDTEAEAITALVSILSLEGLRGSDFELHTHTARAERLKRVPARRWLTDRDRAGVSPGWGFQAAVFKKMEACDFDVTASAVPKSPSRGSDRDTIWLVSFHPGIESIDFPARFLISVSPSYSLIDATRRLLKRRRPDLSAFRADRDFDGRLVWVAEAATSEQVVKLLASVLDKENYRNGDDYETTVDLSGDPLFQ